MELKVKTIDGGNNAITVNNQCTLSSLRESIESVTGVAVDRQRLIFRGKVLSGEDKKLSEFGLADKNVLHMVEKQSNSGSQRNAELDPHPDEQRDRPPRTRNIIFGQLPIQFTHTFDQQRLRELITRAFESIGELGENAGINVQQPTSDTSPITVHVNLRARRPQNVDSPSRERVHHVWRIIRRTNHVCFHVERDIVPAIQRHQTDWNSVNCPTEETAAQNTNETFPAVIIGDCREASHELTGTEDTNDTVVEELETDGHRYNMRHATVKELSRLMQAVNVLQQRMSPLLLRYNELLTQQVTYTQNDQERCLGRHVSAYFHGIQTILHDLSHILHVISDFNIHLCEVPPRRLYPQFTGFQLEEPAEANLIITFRGPNSVSTTATTTTSTATASAGGPSPTVFNLTAGNLPFGPRGFSLGSTPMGTLLIQPEGVQVQGMPSGPINLGSFTTRPTIRMDSRSPQDGGNLQTFLSGVMQNALGGRMFRGTQPTTGARPAPSAAAGAAIPSEGSFHRGRSNNSTRSNRNSRTRVFIDRSSIPWRQSTETTGQQAIFVGPRPPGELPLFTVDQYLPCPSRHLDPRRRRNMQQQDGAGNRRNTIVPSNARVNQNGEAVFDTDEEFVTFLEQILRSVASNMADEHFPENDNPAERQIFAFEPATQLSSASGMISVESALDPTPPAPEQEQRQQSNTTTNRADAGGSNIENAWLNQIGQADSRFSAATLGELIRSMGETVDRDGAGYYHLITTIIYETLGLNDIIAILNGDRTPLDRVRPQMRRHLVVNVLNGNDRPSEQDLISAAARIGTIHHSVKNLLRNCESEAIVSASNNRQIDVIESVLNIDRRAIEDTLKAIFGFLEAPNFAQSLIDILTLYGRQMVYVFILGDSTDPYSYERVLRRYVSDRSSNLPGMLQTWIIEVGIPQLRTIVDNVGRMTESEMEIVLSYTVLQQNRQESRSDEVKETETESATGNEAEENWKRVMPRDWVDVIEKDEKLQKFRRLQQPFSDAYLFGMPAKRRKTVVDGRPTVQLKLSFSENLQRAINQSNAQSSSATGSDEIASTAATDVNLLSNYQQHIEDEITARVKEDTDFEPEKFPETKDNFSL